METIDTILNVTHNFSDKVYAKQMLVPKGYFVGKHTHSYSHLSILAKGKVKLFSNGNEQEYEAPTCINIAAGVEHTIEALEDSVWYCIHATEETDPAKIDQVLITE